MIARKPKLVAEIGCNHKGSVSVAKDMIKVAMDFANVDYVKFQKRTNRELLTPEEYDSPHPNEMNSYGATYGEHREFLEFSLDEHIDLLEFCESLGVGYATSVWDLTAAKDIIQLRPDYIKVPSASNLDNDLIDCLISDYGGDVHVSLGMTTLSEENALIEKFRAKGGMKRLVIYACTSGYPVPHEDTCLYEIKRLTKKYGKEVKAIGFSGHHLGIAIDIAAQVLGASWIERHFTLDRTWKGTDHAASLEPDGLRRLSRDSLAVSKSLKFKHAEVLEIEVPQREKLKRYVN